MRWSESGASWRGHRHEPRIPEEVDDLIRHENEMTWNSHVMGPTWMLR